MQHAPLLFLFLLLLHACGDGTSTTTARAGEGMEEDGAATPDSPAADTVAIHPIFHASVVLTRGEQTIFVDPYNGAKRYTSFGAPDLVLITHTHGDHLDKETLQGIDLSQAVLIGPDAVMENLGELQFKETVALDNGEDYAWQDIDIDAIAMYNLPKAEDAFHPPGKFNGYVVDFDDAGRYYFAGDTEDIEEMRSLEDIDVAFVPMNLPYTMPVERAVDGVLAFAPDVVYPYHYRNKDETFSDTQAFADGVTAGNPAIQVRLFDWYQ